MSTSVHFESLEQVRQVALNLPPPDDDRVAAARARQGTLTKPPGSLGKLEDIACFLAGWQENGPRTNKIGVLIFAGNHGVTRQGISAFPAEVTAQMVANFEHGGAAINALASAYGLSLDVIPLDIDRPTEDFSETAAMSEDEMLAALNAGARAIDPANDIVVLGEMGIGNTTTAAALCAATFGGTGRDWAGPGTGLDQKGVTKKASIIDGALRLHQGALNSPLAAMCHLGGRELAAIAGAALQARMNGIPVLLDGFVACAAVAPLSRLSPDALAHCIAGHVSMESGHKRLLSQLDLEPLLDLNMRLGEGSGAAIAAMVLRGAVATHNNMATFAEASVSAKSA
jgi:nicotinate-nucleotide--dimethylbenzimidazole phosphoribosyltransferase